MGGGEGECVCVCVTLCGWCVRMCVLYGQKEMEGEGGKGERS